MRGISTSLHKTATIGAVVAAAAVVGLSTAAPAMAATGEHAVTCQSATVWSNYNSATQDHSSDILAVVGIGDHVSYAPDANPRYAGKYAEFAQVQEHKNTIQGGWGVIRYDCFEH